MSILQTQILAILESYAIQTTTEDILQRALCEILDANEIAYEREYRLAPRDRIDFYIPDARIGIEAKVDGGTNAVARQLARYCESDEIQELILVTNRAKHRNVPRKLNGKDIRVVFTGRGAL